MTSWNPRFGPSYTPLEMLTMGVFEGKYINNIKEVPSSWKSLPTVVGPDDPPNIDLNYFKVKSRQPLSAWRENGYIKTDPEGWFAWYIKYYLGRRLGEEDDWQINRWRSFVARHQGQINKHCSLKDKDCHTRQRQGLLQWAWDSSIKYTEQQIEKNAKRMSRLTNTKLSLELFEEPKFILKNW